MRIIVRNVHVVPLELMAFKVSRHALANFLTVAKKSTTKQTQQYVGLVAICLMDHIVIASSTWIQVVLRRMYVKAARCIKDPCAIMIGGSNVTHATNLYLEEQVTTCAQVPANMTCAMYATIK